MNPVSLAKAVVRVAVNAVVVAQNVVMMHLLLMVAKPLLPIAMRPTLVVNAQNALSKQSQQTVRRKASSRLPAKMTAKNAHRANVATVTVMVASAVNVVTVPSHRQSKLLTHMHPPLRQRSRSTPRLAQPQLTSPFKL